MHFARFHKKVVASLYVWCKYWNISTW